VKKIAVQIQRSRLQLGKTIEPGDYRSLASGREADVRVADDEDLAGGNQGPSPAASRHPLPQAGEGLSIEIPRPAVRGEGGRRPGEGQAITAHSSNSLADSRHSTIRFFAPHPQWHRPGR